LTKFQRSSGGGLERLGVKRKLSWRRGGEKWSEQRKVEGACNVSCITSKSE